MFDRRLIMNFDWPTLVTAGLISALGVLTIYSSTYPHPEGVTPLYLKQIYWLVLGFGILLLVLACDYRTLIRYGYPFYILCLCLLVLVMVIGRTTSGSQRWLPLGFISFQPSELAKIGLILVMARFFTEKELAQGYGLRDLAIPFLLLALPALLVFKQPDLGTVVLLGFIFLSILTFMGVRARAWLTLGAACAMAAPIFWLFLKDYQKTRLRVFLDPELEPLKTGYHITQSKIAVGSGEFLGKGISKGNVKPASFPPGAAHGFRFFGVGRGMGVCGVFCALVFASVSRFPGIEDRQHLQGPRGRGPGDRRQRHDLLAGIYQYRNGGGNCAGRRGSPPSVQLWRDLPHNDPDRHWNSDERQHAPVYVEPLRGHPHRETGDSPQVLCFSILRILFLSFFF